MRQHSWPATIRIIVITVLLTAVVMAAVTEALMLAGVGDGVRTVLCITVGGLLGWQLPDRVRAALTSPNVDA